MTLLILFFTAVCMLFWVANRVPAVNWLITAASIVFWVGLVVVVLYQLSL